MEKLRLPIAQIEGIGGIPGVSLPFERRGITGIINNAYRVFGTEVGTKSPAPATGRLGM